MHWEQRDLVIETLDIKEFFPSVDPEEFFASLTFCLELLQEEEVWLRWF